MQIQYVDTKTKPSRHNARHSLVDTTPDTAWQIQSQFSITYKALAWLNHAEEKPSQARQTHRHGDKQSGQATQIKTMPVPFPFLVNQLILVTGSFAWQHDCVPNHLWHLPPLHLPAIMLTRWNFELAGMRNGATNYRVATVTSFVKLNFPTLLLLWQRVVLYKKKAYCSLFRYKTCKSFVNKPTAGMRISTEMNWTRRRYHWIVTSLTSSCGAES